MSTWGTFKSQVRRELEEATAGIWTDASLLCWANDAAKDIAIVTKPIRDWQYTTTTAEQASYTLPSGSLEVIAIYCGSDADNDRVMLPRIAFRDVLNIDHDSGKPRAYILDDDAIRLVPTPDKAYELSFLRYALPAEITADTDNMPFDGRYNAAINYYIKAKAYEQVLDWGSADSLVGRYRMELEKIQIQETHEANSTYHTSVVAVY